MSCWLAASGFAVAGCAAQPAALPATLPATQAIAVPSVASPATGDRLDARHTGAQLFELKIFQLAVPEGSVSRNAQFWKPFDETFLDLWAHDVLFKNGVRVGRAPLYELTAIQGQLDNAETTRNGLIGTGAKNVDMELRRGIERETIFAFDAQGRSEGRDYYQVDNILVLGFNQVPRQPDRLHVDIALAIRDQQQKLSMGDDGEPRLTQPQARYDIGLHVELGVDECLIVAPSTVALETSTSLGRAFMTEERPAARVEKVLVIVPQVRRQFEEVRPGEAMRSP